MSYHNDILNRKLRNAVALMDPNPVLKPLEQSRVREKGLIEGLHTLARIHDITLEPAWVDARGDVRVTVKGAATGQADGFGPGFAGWLSQVPHRTGDQVVTSPLMPQNSWCIINHFDLEQMLREADAVINDPATAGEPEAMPGP